MLGGRARELAELPEEAAVGGIMSPRVNVSRGAMVYIYVCIYMSVCVIPSIDVFGGIY